MDFFEVAYSTPTVRRYLGRPVRDAVLLKVLDAANMAPSGSNAQPWEFVIVRSEPTRRAIQRLYQEVWEPYKQQAIIRGRSQLSARARNAVRTGDQFAASLAKEAEVKTLLGVPPDYQLIALMPLGHPAEELKRPYRKPLRPHLHLERWDQPWPKA